MKRIYKINENEYIAETIEECKCPIAIASFIIDDEEEAEEEEVFLEEGETVPLESEVNALEPKEENSEQDQ